MIQYADIICLRILATDCKESTTFRIDIRRKSVSLKSKFSLNMGRGSSVYSESSRKSQRLRFDSFAVVIGNVIYYYYLKRIVGLGLYFYTVISSEIWCIVL